MSYRILITGGAGFVGSHLADDLLKRGHKVRILDNLSPQVYGPNASPPAYLNPDAELQIGDVCNPDDVRRALNGIDAVYHFAAAVGVGQSMYKIADYTHCNGVGTAVLLEAILQQPVQRLVVASSMSIYGEGLYRTEDGELVQNADRSRDRLAEAQWEPCDDQGRPLTPIPTPETKTPSLSSVYALSKYDQERLCLMIGRAYNIPTVALRFFNIFGTRQALSNPYTGVLAIFASRFLNDRRPLVYEDGRQLRDFVSVHDIAQACCLALDAPDAPGRCFNIGSGRPISVLEIAEMMARALNKEKLAPQITAQYRAGDIRHCFADIGLAKSILNYEPRVMLEEGLVELAQWVEGQVADDRVDSAHAELSARGLTI